MHALRISPRAVAVALAAAIAVLVLLSTLGQISTYYLGHARVLGLVRLFALDEEGNVPTWYSSITLLACAALLAIAALDAYTRADRWRRHWAALALIFLYLSVDEAATIHELTIEPLHDRLGVGSFLRWAWVIPGTIAVAVIGIAYLRFVTALPGPTRLLFVTAGVVFLSGALGIEMVSGWWYDRYGNESMAFALLWTAEEALEMSGVAIFLYALVRHLARSVGSLAIAFTPHAAESAYPASSILPSMYRACRPASAGRTWSSFGQGHPPNSVC